LPRFPSNFGDATGVIVSAHDERQSAQQDIIVFDRRILPPVLFEGGPAIIPAESVLATIEVKSTLNATELHKADENARSVSRLDLALDIETATLDKGQPTGTVPYTPTLLFALESDLTGDGITEKQRYERMIGEKPPRLSAICVAGKASWFPVGQAKAGQPHPRTMLPGSPLPIGWRYVTTMLIQKSWKFS
jgi:hypothetical protein